MNFNSTNSLPQILSLDYNKIIIEFKNNNNIKEKIDIKKILKIKFNNKRFDKDEILKLKDNESNNNNNKFL